MKVKFEVQSCCKCTYCRIADKEYPCNICKDFNCFEYADSCTSQYHGKKDYCKDCNLY
jgi:hypothetical protein